MAPFQYNTLTFFGLAFFLTIAALQSKAQQYASLPKRTFYPEIQSSPKLEPSAATNSAGVRVIHSQPGPNAPRPNLWLEESDTNSFSFMLGRIGKERAESLFTSARVSVEDSLLSMNRDPSVLQRPEELAASRGAIVFGRTAIQSLGAYLDANYQAGVIGGFIRETFLDDAFDRRIVSPLSPIDSGNPGDAYTGKAALHLGLRDLVSPNPKGFVTFSDRTEFDLSVKGPAFIVRNPIGIDKNKSLVTALAVEYPNWSMNRSAVPRVGATFAFIHGQWSLNLTATAGRGDFELSKGHGESRYEQRLIFYAKREF
jgi:hypothetical protein